MRYTTDSRFIFVSDIPKHQYEMLRYIGGRKWGKEGLYFPLAKCYVEDLVDNVSDIFEPLMELFEYPSVCNDEDLFSHQQKGVDFLLRDSAGSLIAFEPGLGKTLTVIRAANLLKVCKILVVCPTVLFAQWEEELKRFDDLSLPIEVIKKKGQRPIQGWNLTGYGRLHYFDDDEKWDLIILDESHAIKNRSSKRSQLIADMALNSTYRWSMTGTPISHNAADLWANFRFTHPHVFTSFWRFADHHCLVRDGKWAKEIVGSKNINFRDRFNDLMIFCNYDEADITLPDTVHETIYVDLKGKQKKLYNQAKKDALVKLADGTEIDVDTVLHEMMMLQRITSFAGNVDPELSDSVKLDALIELIQADKVIFPLLVWSAWPKTLDELGRRLDKLGITNGIVHGDTDQYQSDLTIEAFKNNGIEVLGMSLRKGQYGLNLQNTKTTAYIDKHFSFIDYKQSYARVRRIGLDHKTYNLSFVARDTLDQTVIENLLGKSKEFENLTNYDLKELISTL